MLFLDECELHLLPVLRACWQQGPRLRVPTPGTNAKRAFFGALDAASGAYHVADHDRKRAVHFVAFLQRLADIYPDERLTLVLDNVQLHDAKVVRAWCAANPRVAVLWLPRYAAHDAHPAERIWGLMKDKVAANRLAGTLTALVAVAHQLLRHPPTTSRTALLPRRRNRAKSYANMLSADPEANGGRRGEVPRDQVRRGRVCRVGDRCAGTSTPVAADETRRPQQPGDALAGATHALRPQRGVDARRARRPPTARMRRRDLLEPGRLGLGAGRDPTACPGVVGGPGDVQHPAQRHERLAGPRRAAGPLAVHRVSCAKEAAAFRRISRSCCSTSPSRRRRRSASRSAVVRSPGCPWPAAASSCRSQWRNASEAIPRSAASAGIARSLLRARRTASARHSGG